MRPVLPWFGLIVVVLVALAVPGSALREERVTPELTPERGQRWAAFHLADLAAERAQAGQPYLSFLRMPKLHAGLYELTTDGRDEQILHDDDELYYVVKGRATAQVDGEDLVVQPGTALFVQAGVEHRFHSITEDLSILVFASTAPPR